MSESEDVAKDSTAKHEDVRQDDLSPRTGLSDKSMAISDDASQEDASASAGVSETDKTAREDLAKDIIGYLSKEIETVTNGMMVFRSRISFAVLVGPFLILGTLVYIARGLSISISLDGWDIFLIIVVCLCYLGLAFISGRIEEDGWRQCNEWRKLISGLQMDPTKHLNEKNVRRDKQGDDPVAWMKWSYLASCILILVSFGGLLFILYRMQTPPAPAEQPGTNVSTPAQTASPAQVPKQ